MEYVIVEIRNTTKFLTRDGNGKYGATTILKSAIRFISKEKANNVLKNSLSANDKNKWIIRECEGNSLVINEVSENNSSDKAIAKLELTDHSFNWIEIISFVGDILPELRRYQSSLYAERNQLELERSDCLHIAREKREEIKHNHKAKIYDIAARVELKREKIKEELRYVEVVIKVLTSGTIEGFNKDKALQELKNAEKKPYQGRTNVWNELCDVISIDMCKKKCD